MKRPKEEPQVPGANGRAHRAPSTATRLRALLLEMPDQFKTIARQAQVPERRLAGFLIRKVTLTPGEIQRATQAAHPIARRRVEAAVNPGDRQRPAGRRRESSGLANGAPPAASRTAPSPRRSRTAKQVTASTICRCGKRMLTRNMCESCLRAAGYRPCARCSRWFIPPSERSRRRTCPKCWTPASLGRRGQGSSVATVSGGLPSLGRSR
jgi:hypothetical protein